jgi:DHA1 family bicyclomycin/chloramphenicol resistance-like MFS transporter
MIILGALTAFGPLSLDLYLPGLPQLNTSLGGGDAAAQLTLSACLVGLAAGQVLVGPISDRYGRRVPLISAVSIYAVFSLLCAVAPTMALLIGFRLIEGLAGGAGIVIGRAIVRDLYDTDAAAHVYSTLILVAGVTPIVAPVLGGGLLHVTTWRGVFVTLAAIGCALLAAATWALHESLPAQARRSGGFAQTARQFTALASDPGFVVYAGVLALGSSVMFSYIAMSSFVLQHQFGLNAQAFSLVFAANSVGLMIGGRTSTLLLRRCGPSRVLRIGVVAQALSCAVLVVAAALHADLRVLLAPLWLAILSVGLIMPNSTALALDRHASRAGTASGVMGLAQFGLGAVLAPLASQVAGTTALAMAITMTAGAVLSAGVEFIAGRRQRRTQRRHCHVSRNI